MSCLTALLTRLLPSGGLLQAAEAVECKSKEVPQQESNVLVEEELAISRTIPPRADIVKLFKRLGQRLDQALSLKRDRQCVRFIQDFAWSTYHSDSFLGLSDRMRKSHAEQNW